MNYNLIIDGNSQIVESDAPDELLAAWRDLHPNANITLEPAHVLLRSRLRQQLALAYEALSDYHTELHGEFTSGVDSNLDDIAQHIGAAREALAARG